MPPSVSAPGLADPAQPIVGTRLGVAPPVKVRTRQDAPPTAQTPAAKTNRVWIIIGALLAIGAGVALALALVG